MNIVLLIFILSLILIILIALNSITHIKIYNNAEKEKQGTCIDTHYGCCPDGVNSKINFFGTNCPGFLPPPPPVPTPMPEKPIGGCAGTIFGCCPNGITPKMNSQGLNCKFNQ
jgi:hypothetical protein